MADATGRNSLSSQDMRWMEAGWAASSGPAAGQGSMEDRAVTVAQDYQDTPYAGPGYGGQGYGAATDYGNAQRPLSGQRCSCSCCAKTIFGIAIILIPLAAIVVGGMAAGGFKPLTNVFTKNGGIGLAVAGAVLEVVIVILFVIVERRASARCSGSTHVLRTHPPLDDRYAAAPAATRGQLVNRYQNLHSTGRNLGQVVDQVSSGTAQGAVFRIVCSRDRTSWIIGGQGDDQRPFAIPLLTVEQAAVMANRYCFILLENGSIQFCDRCNVYQVVEAQEPSFLCLTAEGDLIYANEDGPYRLALAFQEWKTAIEEGKIDAHGFRQNPPEE